ncbi:MAG: CPBP family intramembrane glutamic endopeptidase [Bacteroidia bacterium]
MATEIISTILQLLVFTAIPFLFHLISTRKVAGFFQTVGLKPAPWRVLARSLFITLILSAPVILIAHLSTDFLEIMHNPKSVTGKIREMGPGWETWATILLIAFLKTALGEELFFRGFVAKKLIKLMGFRMGNIVQAVLFGVIHALLFASVTNNILFILFIFLFPTMAAYLMVILNEKEADGSIFPGWIAHAMGNVFAYSFFAFFV